MIKNCDANIISALGVLRTLDEGSARRIVDMMEAFKRIKRATEASTREI